MGFRLKGGSRLWFFLCGCGCGCGSGDAGLGLDRRIWVLFVVRRLGRGLVRGRHFASPASRVAGALHQLSAEAVRQLRLAPNGDVDFFFAFSGTGLSEPVFKFKFFFMFFSAFWKTPQST